MRGRRGAESFMGSARAGSVPEQDATRVALLATARVLVLTGTWWLLALAVTNRNLCQARTGLVRIFVQWSVFNRLPPPPPAPLPPPNLVSFHCTPRRPFPLSSLPRHFLLLSYSCTGLVGAILVFGPLKGGGSTTTFDVCYHPEALVRADRLSAFRDLVVLSSLERVEDAFLRGTKEKITVDKSEKMLLLSLSLVVVVWCCFFFFFYIYIC